MLDAQIVWVFVNFFWVMDLLLELSMCVCFKLIYFAIGTLSVFMVEFVSLNFNFFGFCSTLILFFSMYWDPIMFDGSLRE